MRKMERLNRCSFCFGIMDAGDNDDSLWADCGGTCRRCRAVQYMDPQEIRNVERIGKNFGVDIKLVAFRRADEILH